MGIGMKIRLTKSIRQDIEHYIEPYCNHYGEFSSAMKNHARLVVEGLFETSDIYFDVDYDTKQPCLVLVFGKIVIPIPLKSLLNSVYVDSDDEQCKALIENLKDAVRKTPAP